MTKGPHRLVLDRYLDSASGGVLQGAGHDWKRKAQELQTLSDALQQAAQQAELRIGEQTLTGPAMRAGMEESSASMRLKSEQLREAGQALVVVGQQVSDTRDARDAMADLGEKPPAYQAPPGSPGVPPTDEEIAAQAAASAARQQQRNAWQSDYDKQEAKSLALTKEMDAAFIAAIPPMQAIHGQQDPTEPPPSGPDGPSGPGGPYLPGTQAPIPTGGGAGGGDDKDTTTGVRWDPQDGGRGGRDGVKEVSNPVVITCTGFEPPVTTTPTTPTTPHVTHPIHVPETGTTTVSGTTQSGVTYQPTGPQVSSPATTGGTSGSTAAALGAAGAAGGAGGLAGAVRPGAVSSSAGAAPARAIGSTGRSGSAGALSRSAGSSPSARSATSGTSASRSAGSAGSTAGRGGAGSRGAASGSTSGSRSGGRGASGARGSGTGAAGGRGGRKGERDKTTDRDSLVYDQDWLGDDDVAPGVLD